MFTRAQFLLQCLQTSSLSATTMEDVVVHHNPVQWISRSVATCMKKDPTWSGQEKKQFVTSARIHTKLSSELNRVAAIVW